MDDIARYNQERWTALVHADVAFSRPYLDLDPEKAKQQLDQYGVMGEVAGKDVLCLASGGGQQSAAFAVLGAHVTVLDLTEAQLAGDRLASAHYGLPIRTEQGDMRDLSRFANESFDLVWQPISINFIPDPLAVFREVSRVLRPGGLYRLDFHNPFVIGVDERSWVSQGYPLHDIYRDGEASLDYPAWEVWDREDNVQEVLGPREFRHTLSRMFNGLIAQGFVILGLWEEDSGKPEAEPGSWDHFLAVAPPFFRLWALRK
jgi:SAM-dependent methyltransferase